MNKFKNINTALMLILCIFGSTDFANAETIRILNKKCRFAFERISNGLLKQVSPIPAGTKCTASIKANLAEATSASTIYLQPSYTIGETSDPMSSSELDIERKAKFKFDWSNQVCFYYLIDRLDGSEQPEPSITGAIWTLKAQRDVSKNKGSCVN